MKGNWMKTASNMKLLLLLSKLVTSMLGITSTIWSVEPLICPLIVNNLKKALSSVAWPKEIYKNGCLPLPEMRCKTCATSQPYTEQLCTAVLLANMQIVNAFEFGILARLLFIFIFLFRSIHYCCLHSHAFCESDWDWHVHNALRIRHGTGSCQCR